MGTGNLAVNDGTYSPAMALSKGNAPKVTTSAPTEGTGDNYFKFVASDATLLWDSVNGHTPGNDHVIASMSLPRVFNAPGMAYSQFFIPSLRTADAGSYYCTFYDGSGAEDGTGKKYGNSGFFNLVVTTFSGSGSSSLAKRSQALDYSLVFLSAAQLLV